MAIGLLIAGILLAGISWWVSRPEPLPDLQLLQIKTGLGATSADKNIEQLDQGVRIFVGRAETVADQWVGWEGAAYAYLNRARFTGSYDDYVAAGEALDKAFSVADNPFGPWEAKAQWAMAVHRLDEAEEALNVAKGYVIRSDSEKAATIAMFGDLAMHRGNYDAALADYNRAAELSAGTVTALRIANLQNKMGRPDDALLIIDDVMAGSRKPSPQFLAFVLAQVATIMIEQGEWEAAKPYLARANRVFPGWWLVDAMRAQAMVLDGKTQDAIDLYTRVATITRQPEVMDALAALLRSQGRIGESRGWVGKAKAIWDRRIEQLPEAAYAHAFDHEMFFGSPEKALKYAQKNMAARPFGESQVLLASALIKNGQPNKALRVLDKVDASGWRSARQYSLRAEANQMLGHNDDAENAMEKAKELNPLIDDPRSVFVWFGHG